MKYLSILIFSILTFATPAHADPIDVLSQTYSIQGAYQVINPPEAVDWNISGGSSVIDPYQGWNYAYGSISPTSISIKTAKSNYGGWGYSEATAEILFSPDKYETASFSIQGGSGSFAVSTVSLMDQTTGNLIFSLYQKENLFVLTTASGTNPFFNLGVLNINFPILSNDIYLLKVMSGGGNDPAYISVDVAVAMHEPSTLLLMSFGLIGLFRLKRKFIV